MTTQNWPQQLTTSRLTDSSGQSAIINRCLTILTALYINRTNCPSSPAPAGHRGHLVGRSTDWPAAWTVYSDGSEVQRVASGRDRDRVTCVMTVSRILTKQLDMIGKLSVASGRTINHCNHWLTNINMLFSLLDAWREGSGVGRRGEEGITPMLSSFLSALFVCFATFHSFV